MAKILIKRGLKSNIGNLSLEEGELALAYNADKTSADLYTSDGNGGTMLLNPDVSGEVIDTLSAAISNKLDANSTIDGGTF